MVVSDAYMLSEVDDSAMAAQLAALQRVPSSDTHRLGEQLRSVCLGLLCAAMQWDEFRCSTCLRACLYMHALGKVTLQVLGWAHSW